MAVAVHAIAAREIPRRDHAPLERLVPRVDPRVDHGHRHAFARQRPHVAGARPHLIGADALGRRRVEERTDPDVARQMVDRLVLPERAQLTGVDEEDRAARETARDRQVVARGEKIDLRLVAMDDDADGL